MYNRKEHLFKKNNRYAKNVKKNVLVAGEKYIYIYIYIYINLSFDSSVEQCSIR